MTDQQPSMSDAKPRVGPGGLVTVAYLKARLDEGEDQLGIFLPLVLDVLPDLPNRHFSVVDVQEAVATRHGVSMPQETVATLLKRATRKGKLIRDAGRYHVNPASTVSGPNVTSAKAKVEAEQLRLGRALLEHGRMRGLPYASEQDALDSVLRFLEEQQVALILGAPLGDEPASLSRAESAVVAEFLRDIVAADSALTQILRGILEGLVLYHAAFLPDLAEVSRKFANLTVVFDTVIVRQALGYEGTAPKAMLRETIDLLTASGVRCVVLDKSVREIQRILSMYQEKLATSAGRTSLRQTPMTRHLLTQCYSPSDIQEMSALLDDEIRSAGFTIIRAPQHVAEFTHDEAKLAARLADPRTRDVTEPRVEHDVDCIAGVLTLRRGHRSYRVEDARAIFATVSPSVIQTIRLWWEEDELESSVAPIVHVRALANLAWLKKPSASPEFQIRDLVALCTAAMRPTPKMWKRFLTHLDDLHKSQRLSEDQATAIVVSAMSDRLLHDAESDHEDPGDVDAATLDEVVERVISEYTAQADERLQEVGTAYEQRIAAVEADATARATRAETTARNAVEVMRRRDLSIDGRARRWAQRIATTIYWVFVVLVVVASGALILRYSFEQGWIGVAVGLAVLFLTGLETVGVLGQLRSARLALETRLYRRLRVLLSAEATSDLGAETGPTPPIVNP